MMMEARHRREKIGSYSYRAIVQDAIHGSIRINDAEYWILQTPFMRRLHGIRQLGLNFLVFPSATHTRLSHSLGVMYIASRMAERVARLAERDSRVCAALMVECSPEARASLVQIARIAGLIHDIGHTPFSHVGEEALFQFLHEVNAVDVLSKIGLVDVEKPHEAYTYYFGRRLVEMARDPGLEAPDRLDLYIEFVVESMGGGRRLESVAGGLGLYPESADLVKSIISGGIADADRLDYLRRDAWFSGVIYGYTDLDRMIEGIYVEVSGGRAVLRIDRKTIQSLEDVFDSRLKMYRSVYHHHKSVAFKIALKRVIDLINEHWSETGGILYGRYDSLVDLLDPDNLSQAIAGGIAYFDDVEMEAMSRMLLRIGDRVASRWAKALLYDRRLVPISLVKRQEDLVAALVERGGGADYFDLSERLLSILNKKDLYDQLREALIKRISSIAGVDPDSMEVYMGPSEVGGIKSRGGDEVASVYLNFLGRLASIPTIHAYVYSDLEEDHVRIYKSRDEVRKAFLEVIRGFVRDSGRGLRASSTR